MSDDTHVRKPNLIIQAGQDLTAIQQNVFYNMLRRFSYISTTTDDPDKLVKVVYEIPFSDLVHNYDRKKGGELFERVKSQVAKLAEQTLTIREGDKHRYIPLFSIAEVTDGSSIVQAEFNIKVIPILTRMIREGYTKLVFNEVLCLRSAYAKRIYELASLHRTDPKVKKDGYFRISVEDFRFKLGITDKMYTRWVDMRIRVIDPSVEEIHEKTSIRFTLDYEKSGRKITHLLFRELVLVDPVYNAATDSFETGIEQVVLDMEPAKQPSLFDSVEPQQTNPLLEGLLAKDQQRISEKHTPEYIAYYHKKVKQLESKGRLKSTFANCLFAFIENDEDDFYNRPAKETKPVAKSSPEIERRLADRKKVQEESERLAVLEEQFSFLPKENQQERIIKIKESMPFFSEEMARKQAILELAKETDA